MMTLKELSRKDDVFVAGHELCSGCAIPCILKVVLRASKYPLVIVSATGCLQMATTQYPQSSWKVNWLHASTSGAAAVMTGVISTWRSLKKKGKLSGSGDVRFLVIAGDGSTNDIGLSSLSGALDSGLPFVYLCYDNQLYANTGGQSSSASPMGVSAADTPAGVALPGKLKFKKNIPRILAAHKIPYMAQAVPWIWQDLYRKAERAFDANGPAFLNVLSPCPTEWKTPAHKTVELTRLAVETCVWPVYEVKYGNKVTINHKPKNKLPVTDWLCGQPRFRHLLMSENKWIIDKIQEEVDKDWNYLLSSESTARDN